MKSKTLMRFLRLYHEGNDKLAFKAFRKFPPWFQAAVEADGFSHDGYVPDLLLFRLNHIQNTTPARGDKYHMPKFYTQDRRGTPTHTMYADGAMHLIHDAEAAWAGLSIGVRSAPYYERVCSWRKLVSFYDTALDEDQNRFIDWRDETRYSYGFWTENTKIEIVYQPQLLT